MTDRTRNQRFARFYMNRRMAQRCTKCGQPSPGTERCGACRAARAADLVVRQWQIILWLAGVRILVGR